MEVKCAFETVVPSYRTLTSTFVTALNLVTIQKNTASLHQDVLHFQMPNGLTAEVQIYFLYALKKYTTFTAPIFTELIYYRQHYV
jgi:hypothetical protein